MSALVSPEQRKLGRKVIKYIAECYETDVQTLSIPGRIRYPDAECRFVCIYFLDKLVYRDVTYQKADTIIHHFGLNRTLVYYAKDIVNSRLQVAKASNYERYFKERLEKIEEYINQNILNHEPVNC